MESIKSDSQRPSTAGLFSNLGDFAKRTAIYSASSALSTRFISPLDITGGVITGVVNSAFVTAGQKFTGCTENSFKKVLVTMASLALSTLAVTYGGSALMGRIGIALSREVVVKLAFVSAFGELVKVSVPLIWDRVTAGPALPEGKEDVEKLSDKQIRYIVANFDNYDQMNSEAYNAFNTRVVILELMPKVPASLEDVQKLSSFDVRYIFENYSMFNDIEEEPVLQALHMRFFEKAFPFPEEKTIQSIKDTKEAYPVIDVKIPETVEGVKELKDNQLPWLFASMNQNYKDGEGYRMSSRSLDVQAALYDAFRNSTATGSWHYTPHVNAENIEGISEETIKILFSYFDYSQKGVSNERFICLPMAVKNALNEKFQTIEKGTLHLYYKFPTLEEIPGKDSKIWNTYFTNNPEQWAKVGEKEKAAFNELFLSTGHFLTNSKFLINNQ